MTMSFYDSRQLRELISIRRAQLSELGKKIAQFSLHVPSHIKTEEQDTLKELNTLLFQLFRAELDPIFGQSDEVELGWLKQVYLKILGHVAPEPRLALPAAALPLDRVRHIYEILISESERGYQKFAQFIGAVCFRYPALRQPLETWFETICEVVLPLSPIDFYTNPDVRELFDHPTLFIKIEDTDVDGYVYLEGGLWLNPRDRVLPLASNVDYCRFDDIETSFAHIYDQALDLVPNPAMLQIDFFLGARYWDVAAHRWKMIHRINRIDDLGHHHLVTIRSYERTFAAYKGRMGKHARLWRQQWKTKWAELGHWNEQYHIMIPVVGDALYDALMSKDEYVCVVECCRTGISDRSVLIEASIPIGVWLDLTEHPVERYAELRTYMNNLPHLYELPKRILQSRKCKDLLGEAIILFWDDPNRRPYCIEDLDDSRRPPIAQSP
jgi:hypothetical protein